MPPSKPIHPATVHFPIAFLMLSYTLDLLHFVTSTTTLVPTSITSLLPSQPTLALTSHYSLILGLGTGVIAIGSGIIELIKMMQHSGLYEADGKTVRPKMKIALLHAGMNDVGWALALYSWYVRRGAGGLGLEKVGGGVPAAPAMVNVVIAALSLPALAYSASLGGVLVYNYGVGLSMGKKGKTT